MSGMLTELHHGSPRVWRELFLAVFALLEMFRELHHETFLNLHAFVDFFGDGQLDLDSSGMRLGIEEDSVYQFHVFKSTDTLETESEQFLAFSFGVDPRRTLVASAIAALIDDGLFGDTLTNRVLSSYTS